MRYTKTCSTRSQRFLLIATAVLVCGPVTGRAALLDRGTWVARDAAGTTLGAVHDNALETGASLSSTQGTVRCIIDLGSVATVHRVIVTPARGTLDTSQVALTNPRSVQFRVSVNSQPQPLATPTASREIGGITGVELRVSASLRFQPAVGRYVVIEVARGDLPHRWNVGEVELYGWPGDRLTARGDAVVLAGGSPAPLKLAADELTYYLGELAGRPVPTIQPGAESAYTGTLYRIVDLKPLAQSYEQMTNNLANGALPAIPVNVERNGREVVFRAWPYRNVLWSVWEFLERQGIRWVYPDAHGEVVPAGQGVNLDVLPLQYTPSTEFIYANFGVEYLRNDPDAFLHFWRNRWSHTWGGHQRDAFGGSEVPKKYIPNVAIHPDHVEGLAGYPHNFNNVLPPRILEQHMEWCGILTNSRWASWVGEANFNRRALPRDNGSTFDLTNPDARAFIINKVISYFPEHSKYHGSLVWMLPEDSTLFSEDPQSVALRQPQVEDYEPYAMPYPWAVSGDYYDFICAIAEGVQNDVPDAVIGAMAYSNTHLPPERGPFPDNVLVDVCFYGARNLPLSSPKNAEMKSRLLRWRELASRLRHYNYDLIHSESGPLPMPVPLVTAMADRARFLHEIDMPDGGTQADLDTIPYNPWNYYAYPRFYWDASRKPADVLREFFLGFYREAGLPMLSYYTTLERYLIANNVSLQARGYDYGLRVGAYPIGVLRKMHQHLSAAESQATYWVTRERVRKAREGLNWILNKRGLTYEDLSSTTGFLRAGPDSSATIDLRFASIQTAGQDVGDAWFLFSWAEVGDYVLIEQPGRYRVTIQAGIGYTNPEPGNRQMMFHIGGIEYGPFVIDHVSVDTYTLLVEIPAGLFEVAVVDLYNRGPFKVASIQIERDGADDQPVARATRSTPRIYDFASSDNPAGQIDSDWDEVSDIYESVAGTDEYDPDSFFASRSLTSADGTAQLRWSSVEGKRYAVYRARDLLSEFQLIASDLPGTPPENTFADAGFDASAVYQVAVY